MLLGGYRIVEVGSHIAAPATAGMLADWGAEVVKIETGRGDPLRWQFPAVVPGGSSANFEFDNRGKHSIVLDYRRPEGRDVLARLLADADVFISNFRPGSLLRAGLDYPTLHAAHPRLVYTSITGYGLQGEAADDRAFDITAFWSGSGLAGQMWPAGMAPLNWRPGVGDHITALSAALGTVVALLERERTGQGRLVESSLLRAGAYAGGFDLAEQLRRGQTIPTLRRDQDGARVSNYFPVADGRWICVWATNPADDWPAIFAAAGRPEIGKDQRFATPDAIAAHGPELTAALDAAFGGLPFDLVASRLSAAGIVWAPVLTAADVARDPLADAAGCIVEVEDGQGGSYRAPAPPIRFEGDGGRKQPAPLLGEHTDRILAQLGYDRAAIDALRRSGAIR